MLCRLLVLLLLQICVLPATFDLGLCHNEHLRETSSQYDSTQRTCNHFELIRLSETKASLPIETVTRSKRATNIAECETFITSLEPLKKSLQSVQALMNGRYNDDPKVKSRDQCDYAIRNINSLSISVRDSLKTISKFELSDSTFINEKTALETKFKELQNFIENIKSNDFGGGAWHWNLLLLETISFKPDLEQFLLDIQNERDALQDANLRSCVSQILKTVDNVYPRCANLSTLISQDISILRSIIQSVYSEDTNNISPILSYISTLDNATRIVICFEALLDEMLNNFHIDHPKVLEIYFKIDKLRNSTQFLKSVKPEFKFRTLMLQNLLSSPIESVITLWAAESEENNSENVSYIDRECPNCIDLLELSFSDSSILKQILSAIYSNNSNKALSILNFSTKLPSLVHKITCFEILFEEMRVNDHLLNPIILIVDFSFGNHISQLENGTDDLKSRARVLKSSLSFAVKNQINAWSHAIRGNEINSVLTFVNGHSRVFENIASRLVKATFSNTLENTIPTLRFTSKLSQENLTLGISAFGTLIHEMAVSGNLRSPLMFVLNFEVEKLLTFSLNISDEITNKIYDLKSSLASPVRGELEIWARMIEHEEFTEINNFSTQYPVIFQGLLHNLVQTSYSNRSEMVTPVLKFAIQLPNFGSKIIIILIDEMTKSGDLNSPLVFVIDYYIDQSLAKMGTKLRKSTSQTLKSKIFTYHNNEITKWATLVISENPENITYFAKKYPEPFELVLEKIIRNSYSGIEANIYPILKFGTFLENVNHRVLSYVTLVNNIIENQALETPMAIIIDHYLESTVENRQYENNIPKDIKFKISLMLNALSRPISNQINHWTSEITQKIFENVTSFSHMYPKSFDRVLPQIINRSILNNENNIFPLLLLATNFDVSHQVVCYEILVETLEKSNELTTSKVLVVQDNIQRALLEQQAKQSSNQHFSYDKNNRLVSLSNKLAVPVLSVTNTWQGLLHSNTTLEIINFANMHDAVFERMLPRFITTGYAGSLENALPFLNLCRALHLNTNQAVVCHKNLIESMTANNHLNSQLTVVIDDAIERLIESIKFENSSSALKGDLLNMKQILKTPLENVILNWTNLIALNSYDAITNFSHKFPLPFNRTLNKVIDRTFSAEPNRIESLLCFAAKLPSAILGLKSFSVLVAKCENLPNTAEPRSKVVLAYVKNSYRVTDGKRGNKKSKVLQLNIDVSKPENSISCVTELRSWVDKVFSENALMQFATSSPNEFELVIGLIMKIKFAIIDKNYLPFTDLGLQLHATQSAVTFKYLMDFIGQELRTPLVFVLDHYLYQLREKPEYAEKVDIRLRDFFDKRQPNISQFLETQVSEFAGNILSSASYDEYDFLTQRPGTLSHILPRVVQKTYNKNISSIEPLLRFSLRFPQSQRILLYDILLREVVNNNDFKPPLVTLFEQKIIEFKNNPHLNAADMARVETMVKLISNSSSIDVQKVGPVT